MLLANSILVTIYLIQRGPSKPDEIFGGGSNIGDLFVIIICFVVLLFSLVIWIAGKFSSDSEPKKVWTAEDQKTDNIATIENLIERGKSVKIKTLHVFNYKDKNELLAYILNECQKPISSYSRVSQDLLEEHLQQLSLDEIRGVTAIIEPNYRLYR